VIDGGKGVWGDIPMTPHAGLSKEKENGKIYPFKRLTCTRSIYDGKGLI
jgi:cytochrome c551/c552